LRNYFKLCFEQQIEKIQIIRQQLQLTTHEKIYFRTHRNFIENHEWLGFRETAESDDHESDESDDIENTEEYFSDGSTTSAEDPFVRLDTVTSLGHHYF